MEPKTTKNRIDFLPQISDEDSSFRKSFSILGAVFLLSTLIGVPLGLFLARIFRKILPMDLFFGRPNLDLNVKEGLVNVLIFLLAVIVTLWLVTIARYMQLKRFVEKNGAELEVVGQIRPLEYLQKTPNGTEVW